MLLPALGDAEDALHVCVSLPDAEGCSLMVRERFAFGFIEHLPKSEEILGTLSFCSLVPG